MPRETVHIVRSEDATAFHEHSQCGRIGRATRAAVEVSRDYAIDQLGRIACPWCSGEPPERGGVQQAEVFEKLGLPRDLAYNPSEGDGGDH